MTSRALMAKRNPERVDRWTGAILAEKPFRLATTAMANKTARIAWALLTKRQDYTGGLTRRPVERCKTLK